ncbi:MAG: hypothetical protein Q7T48_07150 [Cellvibrio sp.]|uniref:hypothetical protein n=1 Tax=Cellvibrio sp. TaxID=1965322 RepID=UPI00272821A2|nr:hypothetical protein [Cellvibrio sp.]
MTITICPKCRYQRQTSDQALHPDICPSCGIVYSKFIAKKTQENLQYDSESETDAQFEIEKMVTLRQQLITAFLYVPERVDAGAFWARVACLVAFTLWGGYFITGGVDWEKIGSSFMHNINLPFHEFGHILFMPFGEFMMILGGSLFQVLLPLALMCVFVFKQRDTFAGSIMLWWCGQSFIDVSPYIADAEYRALPLVGGGGEESHDWGNLLTMMNALDSTQVVANCSFGIGALLIIAALVWGGLILKAQQKNLVSLYE